MRYFGRNAERFSIGALGQAKPEMRPITLLKAESHFVYSLSNTIVVELHGSGDQDYVGPAVEVEVLGGSARGSLKVEAARGIRVAFKA